MQENAAYVEMPDIVEDIRAVAEEVDTEYYEDTKRFSGSRYTLEDSIITEGSFRFNVARITGTCYKCPIQFHLIVLPPEIWLYLYLEKIPFL